MGKDSETLIHALHRVLASVTDAGTEIALEKHHTEDAGERQFRAILSRHGEDAVLDLVVTRPVEREARFYQLLGTRLAGRMPEVVDVIEDPTEEGWLVVSEALPERLGRGTWQGNEFQRSLAALADVHGRFWDQAGELMATALFEPCDWAALRAAAEDALVTLTALAGEHAPMRELVGPHLGALERAATRLGPRLGALAERCPTLLHGGDPFACARARTRSPHSPIRFVGWSRAALGPAELDLARWLDAAEGARCISGGPGAEQLLTLYLAWLPPHVREAAPLAMFSETVEIATVLHLLPRLALTLTREPDRPPEQELSLGRWEYDARVIMRRLERLVAFDDEGIL